MIQQRIRHIAAWLWALMLLLCVALLVWQLTSGAHWDTRIVSLLPETKQSTLLLQAEQRLMQDSEREIVLLIGGPQRRLAAQTLRQQLLERDLIQPATLLSDSRPDQALGAYRHVLLADKLARSGVDAWVERGLTRLFSPGMINDLRKDPFGLQDAWLEQQLGVRFGLDGDFPQLTDTNGQRWLLVNGTLTSGPYELATHVALRDVLQQLAQAYPQATLLRAGLVFHAAAGAEQARKEISTIGIGSLLGIILVLWLVFRNLLTLSTLVLPLLSGLLLALPISWAIFGSLSLVTLAFGASLIGIAVDYALHLQCVRHLEPERPLTHLWPAMWVALLSSLAAFLIQLATPFPGLRQMAVFAALGLTGAWLTMRLWLPLIAPRPHPATARIATRLARLRLPAGARLPWLILLAGTVLATCLILGQMRASNDLRQLNPSPAALIAEQQKIQRLLQRPGAAQYLIVSAPDEAELLERLEQLDVTLARLHALGQLSHYRHLAQAVPSPERQQRNHEQLAAILGEALPRFTARAGLPLDALQDAMPASPNYLSLADWFASPMGRADQMLALPAVDGQQVALVLLGEVSPEAAHTLQALQQPGVLYHDRVQQLGQTLGDIRNRIATWLTVAVAAVALILALRYRCRMWRVLLPPLGALLFTLAALSLGRIGLTLFHLLGLLLVLGIGLDAGIFSVEHKDSSAAWLGISLSCLASLLAFGLLSFSATPALAQLGLACLIGLGTVWLLVPFARAIIPQPSPPTSAPRKHTHGQAPL